MISTSGKVSISGSPEITGTGTSTGSAAILAGSVEISGSPTISHSAGSGISMQNNGSVVFKEGCDATITGERYGINDGLVTVEQGAKATVTGGSFNGIYYNSSSSPVTVNGQLTVSSTSSSAVYVHTMNVEDGVLLAETGGGYAIYCNNTMNVSGTSHIFAKGNESGIFAINVSVTDVGGYYWYQGTETAKPTDLHSYQYDSTPYGYGTYYELVTTAHLKDETLDVDAKTIICVCGDIFSTASCSGGTATCASGPVCITCGIIYGTADDLKHVWGYSAEGNVIPAACENGCNTTATLTLNEPSLTTYGGSKSAEATVTVYPDGALTASRRLPTPDRTAPAMAPTPSPPPVRATIPPASPWARATAP